MIETFQPSFEATPLSKRFAISEALRNVLIAGCFHTSLFTDRINCKRNHFLQLNYQGIVVVNYFSWMSFWFQFTLQQSSITCEYMRTVTLDNVIIS